MSARKPRLVFSAKARQDLHGILIYTAREWGEDQQADYAEALDRASAILRDNPEIGRLQQSLANGVRGYIVQQHIIYYRVETGRIRVLCILHKRMDPSLHDMK